MNMRKALITASSTLALCLYCSEASEVELDEASRLFAGHIEVVAADPEFVWLEGPLWSSSNEYLLFSDVKWADESGVTCGMIWKLDAKDTLSKFLECSGLVGPGDQPENIEDYAEAGSNGLAWGWKGETDLLVAQHGMARIVRFDPSNVVNGSIDDELVTVVVDDYDGAPFNSPNDLVLSSDGQLYFTDPPFGLQMKSAENPFATAFEIAPRDPAVYKIPYDPQASKSRTQQLFKFDKNITEAPNGVAVVGKDIVNPITNFEDPRVHIHTDYEVSQTLELEYRIEGEDADFPALVDGATYYEDLGGLFVAGPGGVYIYDTKDGYKRLGFLRINDLVSNVEVGGGYLWITANQRLLRIRLASSTVKDEMASPGSSRVFCVWAVMGAAALLGFLL